MFDVMVADDDYLMRKALIKMISQNKEFSVRCEATNGEEAVKLSKENHIDIVFMDIIMPKINGIDAMKMIKKDNPNTTFFIISAYSEAPLMRKIMEIPVKKYLQKPIAKESILYLLSEYEREHSRENDAETEKLYQKMRENHFVEAIETANVVLTKLLREGQKDYDKIQDSLMILGEGLMAVIDDYGRRKKVQDVFPVQNEWLKNEEILKLWIFQIINYVWQKRSIQRYSVLELVFLYIEQHIKENITLAQIVKNGMVSQGYLSRIFREQFSISVMEYVRLRKLHMVKVNLIFSKKTIGDIAQSIGYSDASHLAKVFLKYEKIKIKDYREKCTR